MACNNNRNVRCQWNAELLPLHGVVSGGGVAELYTKRRTKATTESYRETDRERQRESGSMCERESAGGSEGA
jgi:hypothetical protein